MGLIELIKLAFADDQIFIPLDSEYVAEKESGDYIWDEPNVVDTCSIDHEDNMQKIKKLIDNGLPEQPEGEAPEFKIDGRE